MNSLLISIMLGNLSKLQRTTLRLNDNNKWTCVFTNKFKNSMTEMPPTDLLQKYNNKKIAFPEAPNKLI